MFRRTFTASLASVFAHDAYAAEQTDGTTIATFTILADFVRRIVGTDVPVSTMIGVGADPHTFQPRPADLARLRRAGAIVANGLHLEPWLDRVIRSAGARPPVLASRGVPTLNVTEAQTPQIDPHIWQDPRRAIQMVQTITDELATSNPAQGSAYRERAAAFQREISDLDAWIEQEFASIPGSRRTIITSHDAFNYFGQRYGIKFAAPQGINSETEPSPKQIARLAAQIRREKVRVVFLEHSANARYADALVRESGAALGPTLYSDSLSRSDGPAATYLDLLRHNSSLFSKAMKSA